MSIEMNISEAKAANLHMSDTGRWIVWQPDPGVCLGIGDTEELARQNAIECGVGSDHIDDDDLMIDVLAIASPMDG